MHFLISSRLLIQIAIIIASNPPVLAFLLFTGGVFNFKTIMT